MTSMSQPRASLDLKMRNLVQSGKPIMDIVLDVPEAHHGAYVTSYSTLDKIQGNVVVTPANDTKFDDFEITFEGLEKTFVDKLATTASMTGRTTANHRFLRLAQPIAHGSLPMHPKTFLAGHTYSIPFTFVVPAQLLPRACQHKTVNHNVRHAHLQLPPSLGDPDLAGYGGRLLDDMAPEMARISYFVKARIIRTRDLLNDLEEEITVAEKTRKIRVKPAVDEAPPLSVDPRVAPTSRRARIDNQVEYRLRAEKTIKKGLFKGKSGRLTIESSQPPSLHMARRGWEDDEDKVPASTMARLRLRFDPTDETNTPPRLGSLSSKLKVSTFFATAPRQDFPSRNATIPDMSQGVISESLPLSSRCVASAQWEHHIPGEDGTSPETSDSIMTRRDSAHSGTSSSDLPIDPPEGISKHRPYYTASILVPITMPTSKNFVATFHTCLISRVYALSLNLSVQTPSPTPTSLSLKIPLQVSADGGKAWHDQQTRRPSALSTVQEEMELLEELEGEVEAVWTPRSMTAAPRYTAPGAPAPEAESDLPPGYDALGATGRASILPVCG